MAQCHQICAEVNCVEVVEQALPHVAWTKLEDNGYSVERKWPFVALTTLKEEEN